MSTAGINLSDPRELANETLRDLLKTTLENHPWDGKFETLQKYHDYPVYRVTIDGTSRLLTALTGGPAGLPDDLVRIGLIREDGEGENIHFAFGEAASAGTPQWPAAGVASMPVRPSSRGARGPPGGCTPRWPMTPTGTAC